MNSMQTCYSMKNSFSDVSIKWILPNMIRAVPALIMFGKIHFLLTSENEFLRKYKVTELQVGMEFMISQSHSPVRVVSIHKHLDHCSAN